MENHRRLDRDGDVDPNGLAVALIDITSVRDWTEEDALRDGNKFAAGYFAWIVSNVRKIDSPFCVPAERLIYKITVPTDSRSAILEMAR